MKTVVVGMSGGVDSSVSAFLLKKQGYRVIGLFMKNWQEQDPGGQCHAQKDFDDVVAVCEALQIPYYGINFTQEYQERVFSSFIEEIKLGYTPNPDILCNREIKFDLFMQKALDLGADYLATGHYCQTDGSMLLRGKDPQKDQTYFLYTMQQQKLPKILFPIGHLLKSQVRQIAHEAKLPVAEKKDSTGICFIGKRPFKAFMEKYIDKTPGDFITAEGAVIGQHDGFCFYTIGQRKGLNIGGPGDAWYVCDKNPSLNTVTLVQGHDHPSLFNTSLHARDISWVRQPFFGRCTAKIRYRTPDALCEIEPVDGGIHVRFDNPQWAITPRQSIVFYREQECIGGGLISIH